MKHITLILAACFLMLLSAPIRAQESINGSSGKVYFSQGNLQYQASTNTWKFVD